MSLGTSRNVKSFLVLSHCSPCIFSPGFIVISITSLPCGSWIFILTFLSESWKDGNHSHCSWMNCVENITKGIKSLYYSICGRQNSLGYLAQIYTYIYLSPVVRYGCESWTIKKAECRRIDAFELWCWRRLLRTPWIARRSNQSILKEISPEYPLEGLMLKQKLQYFGHLMRRTDPFEKTLMLGKIEGGRRKGQQRMK